MGVSTAVEGTETAAAQRVRADRIFSNRVMSYFARRYGEGMEVAPMVLWAICQERAALELGVDFNAHRGYVDELLEAVRYVGDESPAETTALAQAWAILSRIVAGEPHSSRTLRETLSGLIELLEVARMRCEQLQVKGRQPTPAEERWYRGKLRAEGFDVAPYRGSDQVNLGPGMTVYPGGEGGKHAD